VINALLIIYPIAVYLLIGVLVAAGFDRRNQRSTKPSMDALDIGAIVLAWPLVAIVELVWQFFRGLFRLVCLISR